MCGIYSFQLSSHFFFPFYIVNNEAVFILPAVPDTVVLLPFGVCHHVGGVEVEMEVEVKWRCG